MTSLPWTAAENEILRQAWVTARKQTDAGLAEWCQGRGLNRTSAEIVKRLQEVHYFTRLGEWDTAKKNLAEQVALARKEAKRAPLYRPKDDNWINGR